MTQLSITSEVMFSVFNSKSSSTNKLKLSYFLDLVTSHDEKTINYNYTPSFSLFFFHFCRLLPMTLVFLRRPDAQDPRVTVDLQAVSLAVLVPAHSFPKEGLCNHCRIGVHMCEMKL